MISTRLILREVLKHDSKKILLRGLATVQRQRRTGLSAAQEKEIVRENWELRCQLATAYRAFEKFGMSEGICNHLTAKAPSLFKEEGVALLVPYGMYWSQVTPECFVGIDLKTAEVIEGLGREPETTAYSIHLGVYDARPDVQCVMHTHPQYSTTLSVLKDPTIQMISQNAARFRTNVAYDIGGYDGIANQGENTEGKRLGQALGDKDVLVMGNHGLLTVGETIPMAYDRHYYFERAAETQVLAYQTGKPLSYLPDDVAKRTEEGIYAYVTKEVVAKHLNALRNVFMKEDPTFIDPKNSEYMEYVG